MKRDGGLSLSALLLLSAGVLNFQRFEQGFGVNEVRRRETFRVRSVNSRKFASGLVNAVLLLAEPRETHRGPQFPGLALLAPGRRDSLPEGLFGGGLVGQVGLQF